MSSPTPTTSPADPWLARFRERVTAVIAGTVVIGTCLLVAVAVWHSGTPESFARVKDLLLFVNPLVGYVIGYYFSKASTEARAESAEETAKSAGAAAQQATEAQRKAEDQVAKVKSQSHETVSALGELVQAAEQSLVPSQPAGGGTLSGSSATPASANDELYAALARAKLILQQSSE